MTFLISFFDTSGVARLQRVYLTCWEDVIESVIDMAEKGKVVTKVEKIK